MIPCEDCEKDGTNECPGAKDCARANGEPEVVDDLGPDE